MCQTSLPPLHKHKAMANQPLVPPTPFDQQDKRSYTTYKLHMADKSQVYDGQARDARDLVHSMSKRSDKNGDHGTLNWRNFQRNFDGAVVPFGGYRPISSKSKKSNNTHNNTRRRNTIDHHQESARKSPIAISHDDDLPSITESNDLSESEEVTVSTNTTSSAGSYAAARFPKRHSCPSPVTSSSTFNKRSISDFHCCCSSSSSNSNSSELEPPKTLLRHKSQPRHRNLSLNLSVSGIMKAQARYSTSDYNDNNNVSQQQQQQQQRRRRHSLPAFHRLLDNLNSEVDNVPHPLDSSVRSSDESWIPLGVVFNPNMEVYVFEK